MRKLDRLDLDDVESLLRRPTVTFGETSKILGIGETNLRDALKRGELDLRIISVGSRRLIVTADVKRLAGLDSSVSP